ncbi:hypothetical protein PR048_022485 [Dryococelus australis]|uniref:SH3 domain-containing protein n=1 Tax=Dryococelus australis TaxID=614101 RepID=A0ABQ9H182_9NEOP|nr:hypothetical protein PR048_022485 [Dryococelus australis]
MKGRGKRKIPEKIRRPAALSDTIPNAKIQKRLHWETTNPRYAGNTARLACRSDEALEVRVTVARIAPSILDPGRAATYSGPWQDSSSSGVVRCLLQKCMAKALYDNIAESPDELAFRRGDLLTVLEQNTADIEGWWLCSLRGRQVSDSERQTGESESERQARVTLRGKQVRVTERQAGWQVRVTERQAGERDSERQAVLQISGHGWCYGELPLCPSPPDSKAVCVVGGASEGGGVPQGICPGNRLRLLAGVYDTGHILADEPTPELSTLQRQGKRRSWHVQPNKVGNYSFELAMSFCERLVAGSYV